MRSRTLLLPGDDGADFEARRREAHQTHRPRTGAERRCVEALVRLEWKIERCERWQEIYDAKHDAVLGEGPDGEAGPHCEADPHRWMHRAMDCMVQAQRMDRHMARVQRRLEGLQQLRRLNFAARLAELEAEEEPFLPQGLGIAERDAAPEAAVPEDAPADAPPAVTRAAASGPGTGSVYGTTHSRNRRNGKAGKRSGEDERRPLPSNGREPVGHG